MSTDTDLTFAERLAELQENLTDGIHLEETDTGAILWREVPVRSCCYGCPPVTAFETADDLGIVERGTAHAQFNYNHSRTVTTSVREVEEDDEDAINTLLEGISELTDAIGSEQEEADDELDELTIAAAEHGVTVTVEPEWMTASCDTCDALYPGHYEGGIFEIDDADGVAAWAERHVCGKGEQ